jgi:hypothetical protein
VKRVAGHDRGRPTQALEAKTARGFFVKVKRLRVELLRKGHNVFLLNANATVGFEHLSDGEILEIPFRHRFDHPLLKMEAPCGFNVSTTADLRQFTR